MKKRTYRSRNVNKLNFNQIKERLFNEPIVFAIDVAKEKQFALLSRHQRQRIRTSMVESPNATGELLASLSTLECSIEIVMESTGTYGDAMRYQFRHCGFDIFQISAKRVSDAQKIYDGVPSLHDAKSATIITRLHREGLSQRWVELTEEERTLNALRREYDMYQSQYHRNQNRLEAYLSRHWPEVGSLLSLDTVTSESLLIEYGSPEGIAIDSKKAGKEMRQWGRHLLSDDKIERVIDSACRTQG